MPFIEVRAFETRFESQADNDALIAGITEVMSKIYGDQVGAETEVVLTGVPRNQWGFGGKVRP